MSHGCRLQRADTGIRPRDRSEARHEAACAIQLAARSVAVEPAALSAAAYRAFCAAHEDSSLPSWLAISVLFVGWQRACEQVGALTLEEWEVEADAVRMSYGDPARRHRAYSMRGHERAAVPLGAAPDRTRS